jgi:hypothetical protein
MQGKKYIQVARNTSKPLIEKALHKRVFRQMIVLIKQKLL